MHVEVFAKQAASRKIALHAPSPLVVSVSWAAPSELFEDLEWLATHLTA
jgi:hypothetical protein